MNSIKNMVVIVMLLGVSYGAFQVINAPDPTLAEPGDVEGVDIQIGGDGGGFADFGASDSPATLTTGLGTAGNQAGIANQMPDRPSSFAPAPGLANHQSMQPPAAFKPTPNNYTDPKAMAPPSNGGFSAPPLTPPSSLSQAENRIQSQPSLHSQPGLASGGHRCSCAAYQRRIVCDDQSGKPSTHYAQAYTVRRRWRFVWNAKQPQFVYESGPSNGSG